MKNYIWILTFLLFTSCKVFNLGNNTKNHLVGVVNKQDFQKNYTWFDENYKAYKTDKKVISELKQKLNDVKIITFMGTWCGDSRREVPIFYKILDEIQYDFKDLKMIAVNRKKKANGLEQDYDIKRVPTFIVLKNNKELGRIIETPKFKIILLLVSAMFFISCADEDMNNNKKKDLIGLVRKDNFTKDDNFKGWFDKEYKNYKPNEEILEKLEIVKEGFKIRAYMGTWCPDSRREVPRFYKIIDKIDFKNLEMIGVNHDKKANGLEEGYDINFVPTFIVFKEDKEVGRIIERPKTNSTLEKDLLDIFTTSNKSELLGFVIKESFTNNDNFKNWFNTRYNNYQSKEDILTQLKTELKDVEIRAYMGTWCPDSRREVPKFYKIMDEIGFTNFDMICVNHDKKANGLEEGYDINFVPTFILFKEGKEVGRFVERQTKGSLEKDLLYILTKDDYKPFRQ